MQANIQSLDFPLTLALENHIRRRIHFNFDTRRNQIDRIHVRLNDINGPRGGADKCCKVHVVLPRKRDVIIEDVALDMYAAIDRAIGRAAVCVNRSLGKQRRVVRKPFASEEMPEITMGAREDRAPLPA